MVSDQSGDFTRMMGFRTEEGYLPGVSTFRRADESIQRVAHRMFGPGDDFSALWHLFELLGDGVDGWEPSLAY
jgi:hypothetical protein